MSCFKSIFSIFSVHELETEKSQPSAPAAPADYGSQTRIHQVHRALQPPFFQILNEADVEFADVEAVDVLTVEVDHVGVGDAAQAFVGQKMVFGAPLEGVLADETVVEAVEMLDEMIAHVERELAAGSVIELGTKALGEDAVELGLHRCHLGIKSGDAVLREVGDCADEIRIDVA